MTSSVNSLAKEITANKKILQSLIDDITNCLGLTTTTPKKRAKNDEGSEYMSPAKRFSLTGWPNFHNIEEH